ncbi:MAG: HIT domain-containing protein [Phycisphaerales bacterium]|nr:HIT domain-containing protein [Phycisphaerales bacterium]
MQHENLWAPWRLAYLRRLDTRRDAAGDDVEGPVNFLAHYWAHPECDESNFVIHRSELGMILLNRYPYANGHLLVALGEPHPDLLQYEPSSRQAFWALVEKSVALVNQVLEPQGVNVGINQGSAAGAGLPEHIHAHIVPRWSGDTNFMTVTGDVRVMPASLEDMAAQYREELS